MEVLKVDDLDDETIRMTERMVVLRVATKHINLWMRQLEMKRKEISELAGIMTMEEVKKDVENEKSLEKWAKRCSNFFTKKVKRALFEEIDNMMWSRPEKDISRWCQQNKVFDEITEVEIEEIWRRTEPGEEEPVRLNGKYVWETAKRVCDFINAHEDLIRITSFGEYRVVMKKIMAVIKEAHNVERKRRHTAKKTKSDESKARIQRAKALIVRIKHGLIKKTRSRERWKRSLEKEAAMKLRI